MKHVVLFLLDYVEKSVSAKNVFDIITVKRLIDFLVIMPSALLMNVARLSETMATFWKFPKNKTKYDEAR